MIFFVMVNAFKMRHVLALVLLRFLVPGHACCEEPYVYHCIGTLLHAPFPAVSIKNKLRLILKGYAKRVNDLEAPTPTSLPRGRHGQPSPVT